MNYKPNTAYFGEFTTSSPTTGAAADADSTPVATANRNGTDDGSFSLTVTKVDTGRYKIAGTVPNGYAIGDVVNVSVAATVGGVAGKAIVDTFAIVGAFGGEPAERAAIAKALLTLDLSTVTGEASRSVLNALRWLRNKWSISGNVLTVTKEDDSSTAWSAALTTSPGAQPVVASDPN